MKKIGFKNFRKFENFPSINLGDVTYLVGQNNAGKSTMVKAAILLIENLISKTKIPLGVEAYFNFFSKKYNLHINTFWDALNFNARKNDPTITFSIQVGEFEFEYHIQPANDDILYNHIQRKTDRTAPINLLKVVNQYLGISISIYPFLQKYEIEFTGTEGDGLSSIETINDMLKIRRKDHKKAVAASQQQEAASILLEIEQLTKKRDILKKQQRKTSNNGKAVLRAFSMVYEPGTESQMAIVREISAFAHIATDSNVKNNAQRLSLIENAMKHSEKLEQDRGLKLITEHSKELNQMALHLSAVLSSIDITYIQAHLASQEKALVPRINHTDEFAQAIENYMIDTARFDKDESIKRFLLKWMDESHFQIGQDFEIFESEEFPGIYRANVLGFDNHWVNIADMGMGTNQLMILLINMANRIHDARHAKAHQPVQMDNITISCPTIMIEEPEQNLHPKIQSQLADLFYELATSDEYKIHLLVETHSEYIIRKSQLLVAKQKYQKQEELDEEPQKVYFFSSDKGVYDMEYQTNGVFAKSFGAGFFDEAGNLAINLMSMDLQ